MEIYLLISALCHQAVICNTDTMETVSTPEEHSLIITDIRFRSDSTQLATSSFDRTVRLWDAVEVMNLFVDNCLCLLHDIPVCFLAVYL